VFLRLRKKPAMSHYEERLERDLSQIKQQVALLAGLVEKALDDAVHALLADDDRWPTPRFSPTTGSTPSATNWIACAWPSSACTCRPGVTCA
jgi:hypothetical protein